MALNNIKFIKGQGGLGRPLPGLDHISSLLFFTNSLPSGFSASERIKPILSVEQAEALGVLNDYSDETKATATYTVTAIGNDENTIEFKVDEPKETVSLGKYTKVAADTTTTLVAAAIVSVINSGTEVHGYTANNAAAVITITARPKLGIFLNSGTPLSTVITGAITGNIAQFTGGVASQLAIYHYHISEYFRMQPQGKIWLSFQAVPGTYNFNEIKTIQDFAEGEIRQMGVYVDATTFNTAHLASIQTQCNTLATNNKPLDNVVYAADLSGTADFATLTNLTTGSNSNVTACIGQDGFATGFELFKAYGKSITNMGSLLGAISLAKVSENIAWVAKFNLSDGVEMNVPAFSNGKKFTELSESLISQLNSYHYVFPIRHFGIDGTFLNDSHTAISGTSDFSTIENNRTIDKAIRGIRANLLPDLNGPITVNSDGTLTDGQVTYFESKGNAILEQMVRDGEISAGSTTVDASQDVLSTSTLTMAVTIVPIGIARNIIVNIKFALSL